MLQVAGVQAQVDDVKITMEDNVQNMLKQVNLASPRAALHIHDRACDVPEGAERRRVLESRAARPGMSIVDVLGIWSILARNLVDSGAGHSCIGRLDQVPSEWFRDGARLVQSPRGLAPEWTLVERSVGANGAVSGSVDQMQDGGEAWVG